MSQKISYDKIDRFILFGGGNLLVNTLQFLREQNYDVHVCTAPRHNDERLPGKQATLKKALSEHGLKALVVDKVNNSSELLDLITPKTFGIGFGPAWIFGGAICDKLGDRFVNFMGLRMPHFLGGAHYTWQILRQTRIGAVNFQKIEKTLNTGPILFNYEYLFHPGCHTPQDFFDRAEIEEFQGVKKFIDLMLRGECFYPRPLDWNFSQFYPYLNTEQQGWIDWSWTAEEIVLFINAFGRPYKGASTYWCDDRIFFHEALLETAEGSFHPFQRGMIYRISDLGLWIAAKGGAILVRHLKNSDGEVLPFSSFRTGSRFVTPIEQLSQALSFEAHYGATGLKKE